MICLLNAAAVFFQYLVNYFRLHNDLMSCIKVICSKGHCKFLDIMWMKVQTARVEINEMKENKRHVIERVTL